MVDRLAIDNGVRAGRVIAGHAADGGAIAGGGVRAEEKSQRAQVGIEFILDDARLDARPTLVGVHLQDLIHVLREIHHHGMPHRLPGQAGAAAAWQHRDLVATGDVHRGDDIALVVGMTTPIGSIWYMLASVLYRDLE